LERHSGPAIRWVRAVAMTGSFMDPSAFGAEYILQRTDSITRGRRQNER
jgi:hypothetical protein